MTLHVSSLENHVTSVENHVILICLPMVAMQQFIYQALGIVARI